jgi:hypothetical protein
VPPEAFADALQNLLPPRQVEGLVEDYAHYARGEADEVVPGVRQLTGREPIDIARFARDRAGAFGAAPA